MKAHYITFPTIILLLISLFSFSAKAKDGAVIFKQNCATCHTVGGGNIVGPDLKGVTDNRQEKWLIEFIKSSQTMVKAGDADAIAVWEKFGKIPMPDHTMFSESEIKSIIAYIKEESTAKPVEPAPVPEVAQVTNPPATDPAPAAASANLLFNGSFQSNVVLLMICLTAFIALVTVGVIIKAMALIRRLQ